MDDHNYIDRGDKPPQVDPSIMNDHNYLDSCGHFPQFDDIFPIFNIDDLDDDVGVGVGGGGMDDATNQRIKQSEEQLKKLEQQQRKRKEREEKKFPPKYRHDVRRKNFANEKRQTLAKMDRSVRRSFDVEIGPLIELINNNSHYYTTSSCSGRVVVFSSKNQNSCVSNNDGEQQESPELIYVGHSSHYGLHWPLDGGDGNTDDQDLLFNEIKDLLDQRIADEKVCKNFCTLKYEQSILHVRADCMDTATGLHALAIQSGYRNSGITISTSGGRYPVVAIRGTIQAELPLLIDGEWVIKDVQMLRTVMKRFILEKIVANEKLLKRFIVNVNNFMKNLVDDDEEDGIQ